MEVGNQLPRGAEPPLLPREEEEEKEQPELGERSGKKVKGPGKIKTGGGNCHARAWVEMGKNGERGGSRIQ